MIAMIRERSALQRHSNRISAFSPARGRWAWLLVLIGIYIAGFTDAQTKIASSAVDMTPASQRILTVNPLGASKMLYESDSEWLWNYDENGNQLLDLKREASPNRSLNRYYYSAREITITNPKKEVSDPTLLMRDGSADALIVEDLKLRMLGEKTKQTPPSATWPTSSRKLYLRTINVKDGPLLAAVRNWAHPDDSSAATTPTLPDFRGYFESIGIKFGHLGPVYPKIPPNELFYNEKAGIVQIHATLADLELLDSMIQPVR
jgi:hypothetical protein